MSTKPAADLWRSWPALMAVVVGYYLLAWLAGWTRIPAGFVVPLFPAAGLALVATLRGGLRPLAAVAIGALAFNLNLQLSLAPWPVAVGLACAVTVGSTLQAFLGSLLIRRLLSERAVADAFAVMLPIFIAGGLVACLCAASISTLAFFMFGGLPAAGVGRFFFTWWTGDAAGVMVCSPFLLAFCGVTIRDFRERLLTLVLPLSLAMAIVLVAFDGIRTFRQEEFASAFADRSDRDGGILQRAIDLHVEVLRGLARSIGNARPLTAEDFRRLVADPLVRYPGLKALSWNPVVNAGERQAHVAAMRTSGLPDYRIVARVDEALVDAPIAPRYVVVAFIEPYAENRAAQGFDINSNTVRRSSIEASELSGLPVTTGRITLAQEQESQFGVLVLAPVLEADGSLQGFVVAVLRLGALLQEVLGPNADPGLRYLLVDDEASTDPLLAAFGADLGMPDVEAIGVAPSVLRSRVPIQMPERRWQLLVLPSQVWLGAWVDWGTWSILLGGSLLVGMLGALLGSLIHRRETVAAEVNRQTATLAAVNSDLETARDQADAANRAKSEFLATISHEIRTPLNGVIGMTQVLADSDLDEQQQDSLQLIETSGQTLLALINDVLDLSQIDSGRLQLESVPTDLSVLSQEVIRIFHQSAEDKGLRLDAEIQAGCPPIMGDPLRLRQLLFNLVGNAIKFTERGSVRFVSRWQEGEGDGIHLELEIRDTGIGIDPAFREQLFHRFSQADSSITRKYGGSGLGLSICARLTELMGGSITATDNAGGGSVFAVTVDLPRAQVMPAAGMELGPLDFTGKRVLVAEDNPINMRVISAMLKRLGCTVDIVDNGLKAAECAADGFDLILMDLQMPVLGGIEAAERIRAEETSSGRPRVPIIALTANAFSEAVEATRRAGMDGHLTKPLTQGALHESLAGIWVSG